MSKIIITDDQRKIADQLGLSPEPLSRTSAHAGGDPYGGEGSNDDPYGGEGNNDDPYGPDFTGGAQDGVAQAMNHLSVCHDDDEDHFGRVTSARDCLNSYLAKHGHEVKTGGVNSAGVVFPRRGR